MGSSGAQEGAYLGQEDLSPEGARRVIGERLWMGISTHNPEQLQAADATSADYLAIGPIFATASKEKPEGLPGSIFRATLDRTHWLTLGYEQNELPVYLEGDTFWRQSKAGANPLVFTGDSLTLSGFTWPDNTERMLRGTAWAVVENQGDGHVVLFLGDPLFRAFWRGPARLVTNAMLLGPNR